MARERSPKPELTPDHQAGDEAFRETLEGHLRRVRAVAEAVKWVPKDAWLDPEFPLHHLMELATLELDRAFALIAQWDEARSPDRRR
jgi:hypothetical protein